MTAADQLNTKSTSESPVTAEESGRAAMTPASFQSPFVRLRTDVVECLQFMGIPGDVKPLGVTAHLEGGRDQPVLFYEPRLEGEIEPVIYHVLCLAGGPLLQKEIAARAHMGQRYVQAATAAMRKRGVILHHPTLGFYLPGIQFTTGAAS